MDKGKDIMNLTLSAMGRDQLFHLRGNTFSREHWLLWKPIERCQSNILMTGLLSPLHAFVWPGICHEIVPPRFVIVMNICNTKILVWVHGRKDDSNAGKKRSQNLSVDKQIVLLMSRFRCICLVANGYLNCKAKIGLIQKC